MFLTGSPGTGKTLMLSEALKIKLSKLKHNGSNVNIFVTTYKHGHTKLLDKYSQDYLVNIKNINFTDIPKLCRNLNIKYNHRDPQSTLNKCSELTVR